MTALDLLLNIGLPILAYLAGSIASAVIVCKLMGLGDPRRDGSGNPGATNVLRLHGKAAAALTLAGDMAKGLLPVLLAQALAVPKLIIALCGLATFVGHLYPLFFGFRGGKGVATLVGVLFGWHWLLGLAFSATWLFVALLFRYASLAAVTATLLTPLYAWLLLSRSAYVICVSGMGVLLIWRHRSNIKHLLAGTEEKIGTEKP